MNPAIVLKAREIHNQLKKHPLNPLTVYEDVQKNNDGTAVYIFEAKFATVKEAEIFKALAEMSKEIEDWMQS